MEGWQKKFRGGGNIYRLLLNDKVKAKQQTLKVHLLLFKAHIETNLMCSNSDSFPPGSSEGVIGCCFLIQRSLSSLLRNKESSIQV